MNRIPAWTFTLGLLVSLATGCGDDPTSAGSGPPRIITLVAQPGAVVTGGITRVTVLATDPDDDPLTYAWSAGGGTFDDSTGTAANWTAPDSAGTTLIRVVVGDGTSTVEGAVSVIVGNASLTIESDPPGALITLDGLPLAELAPYTISPIPPGFHQVRVFNPSYIHAAEVSGVDLVHGQADTVRFVVNPAQSAVLNLGRSDFLEIGGLAYLPLGTGLVYAGRTANGTGIFSSALNPPTGTPSGIRLVSGVRVTEPVTVSVDGRFLLYVTEGDSLMSVAIRDGDGNGLVDSVGVPVLLETSYFSPALARDNELAYSLTAADQPATLQIFRDTFQEGTLLKDNGLATGSAGRLPSWKPNDPFLAFERGGNLLVSFVNPNDIPSTDTLVVGGFSTAPAWGPWGAEHVAYFHGVDAGSVNELWLMVDGDPAPVRILAGLTGPRAASWSPVQRNLAISQNPPGRGEIRLVTDLPIR